LHERVVANSQEARTLTTLRDALLPRLLSGELRVPDAERAVAEVA
jgi:type I restriction enzyme S subunit